MKSGRRDREVSSADGGFPRPVASLLCSDCGHLSRSVNQGVTLCKES